MHDLGTRLKTLRIQRNITAATLARLSGLSKGFVSQIESGRSNPSLESLRRLTLALSVPLHEFLDEQKAGDGLRAEPVRVYRRRNKPSTDPHIEVIDKGPGGTYLSIWLVRGSVLEGTAAAGTSISSRVLCSVGNGSVVLRCEPADLYLNSGDIASWDAHKLFTIEADSGLPTELLLCIPSTMELPVLRQAQSRSNHKTVSLTLPAQGPFRLVAMRAERRASAR